MTHTGPEGGQAQPMTGVVEAELARAEEHGDSYGVPVDSRDPNHHQYFDKGDVSENLLDDYRSHNTKWLDVQGVTKLLLELRAFQSVLAVG